MKIVVLDGYTLNTGDLTWEGLKNLGAFFLYDRTAPHEVLERAKDADILFTNKTPLGKDLLRQLSAVKYIGLLATGFNVVDVDEAKARGIIVTNVPGYGTASVAQMTIALLLELCHRVQRHSDSVAEGKWSSSKDFCYWDYPQVELAGKTMGIIGMGTIGEKVADIAMAFGMKVLGSKRSQTDRSHQPNFKWASVEMILEHADVVSIHCPLTAETKGLINKKNLSLMKPSAFLINTSRGPIVVDEDLTEALKNKVIAGAALDVLSVEPPAVNNPLFKAPNCIITPHIAWATKEARTRLMDIAVSNLVSFIEGRPVNVVNR